MNSMRSGSGTSFSWQKLGWWCVAYKEQNLARKSLAGEGRLLTSPNVSSVSENFGELLTQRSLFGFALKFVLPTFSLPLACKSALWSGDEWIREIVTDVVWHELKMCCFVSDIWALWVKCVLCRTFRVFFIPECAECQREIHFSNFDHKHLHSCTLGGILSSTQDMSRQDQTQLWSSLGPHRGTFPPESGPLPWNWARRGPISGAEVLLNQVYIKTSLCFFTLAPDCHGEECDCDPWRLSPLEELHLTQLSFKEPHICPAIPPQAPAATLGAASCAQPLCWGHCSGPTSTPRTPLAPSHHMSDLLECQERVSHPKFQASSCVQLKGSVVPVLRSPLPPCSVGEPGPPTVKGRTVPNLLVF